jgi:Family of unknown function (DUF6734)
MSLAFQDDIGLVKPMNAMRAVWSFWSKPWRARSGQCWLSERHHLLAWLLSFETARTFYPLTTLVTDDEGARLLVDGLELEFGSVSTALNRLSNHDPALWMLGKLYAYRAQAEPFAHLDTDIFLWKRLPAHIETAPVFAQCPEPFVIGQSYYKPDEVRRALLTTQQMPGWIPMEWEWSLSFGSPQPAACCGVLGGRHVDFIRYYAEGAIRLVEDPRNQAGWASLGWAAHNTLIEQYHLGCLRRLSSQPARFALSRRGDSPSLRLLGRGVEPEHRSEDRFHTSAGRGQARHTADGATRAKSEARLSRALRASLCCRSDRQLSERTRIKNRAQSPQNH